jgi:hypothetical protein
LIAQPELRAALRLAAQTHCTLEELGERMSAEEFGLWLEFLDVEPVGPASLPPMLAAVLAALANGPLQPPNGKKKFLAQDFIDLARWDAPPTGPVEPSAEQIEALFLPK